jgi:outer membrane protein assembly factor BamB
LVGCSPPASNANLAPICCIDADSGTTLWTSARGRDPIIGPSVACFRVGGDLVGLDLKDGRELWKIPSPKGHLFLQGDALLEVDGATLQSRNVRNPGNPNWNATILQDMSPSGIADSVLVVRGKNGLSGLDVRSGRELWNKSGAYSSAVVADGRVFAVPAGGHAIEAYALARGEKLWSTPMASAVWSLLAFDDRTLAVRTESTVEGLSSDSGQSLWKHDEPAPEVDLGGGKDGLLVLVGPKSARVLGPDGKEVCQIKEGLARRVVVQSGRVFSLTGDPGGYRLKGFDAHTGQEVWGRNSAGSGGNFVQYASGHLIAPFEVRP